MKQINLTLTCVIFMVVNAFAQYPISTNQARTDLYGIGKGEAQVFSQNTPFCSDLLLFIQQNGKLEAILYSGTLNSSFLNEVAAFSYNGEIYVVASIQNLLYIYCGTTAEQWNNFANNNYGTYGERFNQYISRNNCNCN